MADSATLKVDRAAKHVSELNELFQKMRPFRYIVETNTKTGERATFAKKDEAVVAEAANISADVVHNLRTALDHAYWEIVSPFAANEREAKAIQFPFSKTATRLDETVKNRLADRVSPAFFKALINLKPHGEAGGNKLLYLIHYLDALDKHRFPIPTGDYTRITPQILKAEVPDIPNVNITAEFGMNRRDLVWTAPLATLVDIDIGSIVVPTTCIFEKELNVPVDIVFNVGTDRTVRPLIPTLNALVDVAKKTISLIRAA